MNFLSFFSVFSERISKNIRYERKFIMKTTTFFIPSALLAGCLLLAGCNRTNTPVTPESGTISSVPSKVSAESETPPENIEFDSILQSLTSDVSETVSLMDNLMPSGTAEEQRIQFFDLKHKIEETEHQLEACDDQLENAFRNSTLPLEAYRTYGQELENLEELLDSAENKLEFSFGMDS